MSQKQNDTALTQQKLEKAKFKMNKKWNEQEIEWAKIRMNSF